MGDGLHSGQSDDPIHKRREEPACLRLIDPTCVEAG